MIKSDICSGCGKLVDSDFFYCPWCGTSRIKHENKNSDELRLKQYQQKIDDDRRAKLEKMSKELDNLEQELSVLVLSAEMSK